MSQNSISISNGTGLAVRTAINNALDSIVTDFSGASAPSSPKVDQTWVDTSVSPNLVKRYTGTSWTTVASFDKTTGEWVTIIADESVTTDKIADDAVTADKLANTSVTAGTYTNANITVDAQGRITTASDGSDGGITLGTAIASISGTSIDFTGIPSTAKRITLLLHDVSTSGGSDFLVQLGSTTYQTSGYLGCQTQITSTPVAGALSSGFKILNGSATSAVRISGAVVLEKVSENIWSGIGRIGEIDAARMQLVVGTVPLGGVLDRVRFTTIGGTDTFDNGTVNISWEL